MKNKSLMPKLLALLFTLGTFGAYAQDKNGGDVVSDVLLLWSLISLALLLVIANFVLMNAIKSLASDKNMWDVIKERAAKNAKNIIVPIFILTSGSAFAQEAVTIATGTPFVMGSDLFYALLTMNGLLLALVFYQVGVLRSMVKAIRGSIEETPVKEESWVSGLTDAVPIENEAEIMMEHEHDGIRELDNNLPPWWLYGFYCTIVFSFIYIGYYSFGSGPDQTEEYLAAMEEAKIAKAAYMAKMDNAIDETNVEQLTDASAIANGKGTYLANCAACHGQAGEGGVGPNFADSYWLHGGGIKNVFSTIKYGVPAKGMIPWEAQLSPKQMQEVASFILTLEGTNPPNPKAPQGEIWKAETPAPAEDSTALNMEPVDSTLQASVQEPDAKDNQ